MNCVKCRLKYFLQPELGTIFLFGETSPLYLILLYISLAQGGKFLTMAFSPTSDSPILLDSPVFCFVFFLARNETSLFSEGFMLQLKQKLTATRIRKWCCTPSILPNPDANLNEKLSL